MKTTTKDGKLWTEALDGTPIVNVGVDQAYYNAMGLVWVFVPVKETGSIKAGDIIAHYESSKGLGSFRSPVSGKIIHWNHELVDYPDRITAEQWLLQVKV